MSANLKNKRYYVKMPYPKPKVEEENAAYGDILLQDYAGAVSELTAINLYAYQHIISEEGFEEYAEIIRGISIVEMKHLELLGETIKLLGVKPIYINSFAPNGQLWTAEYVNYSNYILDMISEDIESETKAILSYQEHIDLIEDKYIIKLLKRIIIDEELHLKIFKELYEKYNK